MKHVPAEAPRGFILRWLRFRPRVALVGMTALFLVAVAEFHDRDRGFTSLLAMTPFLSPARADESWATIEAEAKGQTVYFNAWAGSPQVNAYIAWAADEVNTRYGITLEHVKLTDTAEAVRRVRDEVQVAGSSEITLERAAKALAGLQIDDAGLDATDRKLLQMMLDKFDGGPVGVAAMAALLGESPDTLEDVFEPFLLRIGFLDRTPQGRVVTERGRTHLGRGSASLWSGS